ncbi:MAG: HEPN domain-containing protein [Armatimonadia bacterium]
MPVPQDYIEAWMQRAERDLQTAEAMRQSGFFDACALYCQQAVEKLLKAYYMVRESADPPRTHKLVELAARLGVPYDLAEDLHDLENDYIQSRYPDALMGVGGTAYDDAVAEERLSTVARIREWVDAGMAKGRSNG